MIAYIINPCRGWPGYRSAGVLPSWQPFANTKDNTLVATRIMYIRHSGQELQATPNHAQK